MTNEEKAYQEGHRAGWFRLNNLDLPVEYQFGPLAVEYAQGYKDGLEAELRSREEN